MARLSIRLLGAFQVALDGEPVTSFESDKVRALLAYLAVEDSRPHRREKLAGLLWPERPERSARTNLRRALANLRKAIGDADAESPFLVIAGQTIRFNRESSAWVDVHAFQESLGDSPPQHASNRAAGLETVHHLEDAARLYRGRFLDDFSLSGSAGFEEWLLFVQERLQRMAIETAHHLGQWYGAQGDVERALHHARRGIELDPWWESGHQQVMRLLAGTGNRAEALAQYEACRRLLAEELGVEPSAETRALYERIRDEAEAFTPSAAPRHNLPAHLTPFVGRKAELAQVQSYLRDPACRLLTLVGPGGIGKSRLALEAAAAEMDAYVDGVFQVRLADVESPEAIVPAVAQAIGFSLRAEPGVQPRQLLLNYLQQRSVLLVLDNYEHLTGGAGVVSDLLQAASGVTLLITSRFRLNLQGEQAVPLGGLSFPEAEYPVKQSVGQFDAVELFLSAARRVSACFELAGHEQEVARICRLVQGIPLAILLAAAWVELLPPAEIAGRIEDSIDFLEACWQDTPDRQRSMVAVFDHSWGLLTEHEQELIEALSVFHGDFDSEAALHVAGASISDLRSLLHKSLVLRLPAGRLGIHGLLRQYAARRLDQAPARKEAVHERHSAHYIAALQRWAADLAGPRQQIALSEMDVDINNARAAWDWAAERGQTSKLDAATEGLGYYYGWRWRLQEGEAAFRLAAEGLAAARDSSPTPGGRDLRVLAKLLSWQGVLPVRGGLLELERDESMQRRALVFLDEAELSGEDTRRERAIVLRRLGDVIYESGSHREAGRLYEQSLALYQALGDRWNLASILFDLGGVAWRAVAYDEARRKFEESLAIRQALGDPRGTALAHRGAGYIAMRQGRLGQGEYHQRKALAILQDIGDREFVTYLQMELGSSLLLYAGEFAEARALLEEAAQAAGGLEQHAVAVLSKLFLGAADLFAGEYKQARNRLDPVCALARQHGVPRGVGLSLWLLGCAALAEGARGEAVRFLQEGVGVYRETLQREELAWVLAVLGLAAREAALQPHAQQHLAEAMRIGAESGACLAMLLSVPGAALLLADAGDGERAVELYALAAGYPLVGNTRWFDDVAGRHIAAIAASLPPEVAAAARKRGRARRLAETAEELLLEFGA